MIGIEDGASHFGADMATVYARHPAFVGAAARVGFVVPPTEERDARAAPARARVNHNRWIADCPDCAGAVLVWRAGPHIFMCPDCWNGAIGHVWRRVAMPDKLAEIEALLLARPLPANRNWEPGETIADLRRQNADNGV